MIRIKNPSSEKLGMFRDALAKKFTASFTDHWFPERPLRGNAYRCVRIVSNRMDRLIAAAGADAGLTEEYLISAFPQELSVWIDPFEVSYRIGEDGSVGIIYSLMDNINANDSGKGSSDDELDCCSMYQKPVDNHPRHLRRIHSAHYHLHHVKIHRRLHSESVRIQSIMHT